MTVAKLLLGHDAPMTQMEMYLWAQYGAVQARLDQQKSKRGS